MALTLVTGAVLIGRLIRNFPYLLPNRLPGLVLYELGPALILVAAVGSAVVFTKDDGPRLGIPARLVLFALVATIAGTATLPAESADRKSGVSGTSGSVRVDLVGPRITKKKTK